ncbi:MAG: sugar kinase [Pseudomonadota bacterium]
MNFRDGNVISIGECMIELSRRSDGAFAIAQAGDTFNSAVYLARLTDRRVCYATAVGDDVYSDAIVATAEGEAIETRYIARIAGRMPGLYLIETDAGERTFWYWRDAAAARDLFSQTDTSALAQAFSKASLIYLSGITLSIYDDASRTTLAAMLDDARAAGARVAMDSNYRARGWPDGRAQARDIFEMFWRRADIALPTYDDEQDLWGDTRPDDTSARLNAFGVREHIIKLGDEGCLVAAADGAFTVPCPTIVTPVDTTAAGDSFNAAYLAGRLRGDHPQAAATFAHMLAGCVISHPGGVVPKSATADLVRHFKKNSHE